MNDGPVGRARPEKFDLQGPLPARQARLSLTFDKPWFRTVIFFPQRDKLEVTNQISVAEGGISGDALGPVSA